MTAHTDRQIAELACRCVLRLGERQLPVDPQVMLRLSRGVFLYTREEARELAEAGGEDGTVMQTLGEDVPAASWGDGKGRWAVVWRPETHPLPRRFALAHELGHVALGHHPLPSARRPREEAEANLFARCLLVPPPLLARLLQTGKLAWVEQAARVFGVSGQTLRIALTHPVAVSEELGDALAALLLETALARIPAGVSSRWFPLFAPLSREKTGE